MSRVPQHTPVLPRDHESPVPGLHVFRGNACTYASPLEASRTRNAQFDANAPPPNAKPHVRLRAAFARPYCIWQWLPSLAAVTARLRRRASYPQPRLSNANSTLALPYTPLRVRIYTPFTVTHGTAAAPQRARSDPGTAVTRGTATTPVTVRLRRRRVTLNRACHSTLATPVTVRLPRRQVTLNRAGHSTLARAGSYPQPRRSQHACEDRGLPSTAPITVRLLRASSPPPPAAPPLLEAPPPCARPRAPDYTQPGAAPGTLARSIVTLNRSEPRATAAVRRFEQKRAEAMTLN
ncbi:hypothetical protein DFH27DRAFT_614660 [Peziza echinospora]|nr:hypothetical protein DFH27DRAFT_614660 [Peziza echinospora]